MKEEELCIAIETSLILPLLARRLLSP